MRERRRDTAQCDQRLCGIVNRAVDRGGKIIVPAFAVGRTQQIVYSLHRLTESGRVSVLPMFVDSPLSVDVTAIFRRHPECFNETIFKFMREVENPFGMANLTYIRDVEESKKLNDLHQPVIIISASGMCEAGRIRHHLKNNITDERNTVLMVGYCAEHTLGARIIARDRSVNIFGEPYPLRAHVEVIEAFSGNADKSDLEAWIGRLEVDLRSILLVYGEEEHALALAERLRVRFPSSDVSVPDYKDSVELSL